MERILAAMQRTQTVSEVLDLLGQAARKFGAARHSYHFTPAFERQTSAKTIVAADGFGPEWISLYENEHFRRCDPIPDYVMHEGHIVTWEHSLEAQHLTPDAIDFAKALTSHGLVCGVGVPLYGPDNRHAYLAFGFDAPLTDADDGRLAILAAIGQKAHTRICALTKADAKGRLALSPREREVLTWVGRGKSNNDIATIIGVSPETVKTHIQRIFGKLDVSDRVGATVKALKLAEIRL